jgi:glutaredoxin
MYTQVLGISVDSQPCLTAWADSLGGITYPLLSDFYPHGEIAQRYGVLRPDGKSERALFVLDKRGVIRYIDIHDIDEQPNNDVLFDVLADLEPEAAARLKATYQDTGVFVEPQADVVMYCTKWCPSCRRARAYFLERGVSYVEVDIAHDRAAAARVKEWANGYETTPTFNIRGQILVNFDQAKLDELLGFKQR